MNKAKDLLNSDIKLVNIGLESFTEAFDEKEIAHVNLDWRPPAASDTHLVDLLLEIELHREKIDLANKQAIDRVMKGQPVVHGVVTAKEVIPWLDKYKILHSGPPIEYDEMCGPMQGAVVGAMIYEGWAEDTASAEELIHAGKVDFDCNHHHLAVGPMTGMITESMPVFRVVNEAFGNEAYCTINEGIGEVMRFGANGPSVIRRLKWLEEVLAPALHEAIQRKGGINVKSIMAQALAMGDEMHQRNIAASLIFYKNIVGDLQDVINGREDARDIVEFLVSKNDQFFLNVAMAASKSIMDAARDIPYSTLVTAMSRNGVDFGINISSLGYRWFTAPVEMPVGLYFPGYTEEDANPDMGDSSITECIGIGGNAMGCSPAVVNFIGAGSVAKAVEYTRKMGEITLAKNFNLPMPNMNFEGVPNGFDIVKIVATGIRPVINTGMAHKKAGVGQVGAGIANPPIEIFQEALRAFVQEELKKD